LYDEAVELFRAAGAIKEGHFLLTSGLHSDVYWEKFRILQNPSITGKLCSLIADHYRGQTPDLVAGPTLGGMVLAFEVARQLGIGSIYAEKDDAGRAFRRDYEMSPGSRILIVDDILTTGGSLRETIAATDRLEGIVIGVGVLVDRSDRDVTFDLPVFSCLRAPAVAYAPDECPLCARRVPLVRPGGAQGNHR